MNEYVLPGLVKRRAALAGEMEAAQARVQKLRADVAALDAVIRQFDPAYPVDMIAAKRPRRPASSPAGPDLGRTLLGILRDAGEPVAAATIAERVLLLRGLNAAEGPVRAAVEASVGRTLRHQREKGAVRNPAKAADVLADPVGFAAARNGCRARGFRTALAEAEAAALPLLPPQRLGLDSIHLRWSPALPAAAAAAGLPAGREGVVLTGADTAAAIGWGWEQGIALFEGRLLRPRGG